MFRAYLHILGTPHVRSRLAAVFLSSMPLGMLSLAIVLCVQGWTGELRAAGVLSGLFGAGNAAGLSIQGPLIDRYGAHKVVLTLGSACTLTLFGFVALGALDAPLWSTAAVVTAAGVSVPAITTAVRSWLPEVFSEDTVRATSYALLSALFRGAVTIGPLLVSASMLLYGAEIAVMLAAGLILVATGIFSFLGRRGIQREAAPMTGEPRPRFSLSPGLWTLLVSAGLLGFAVGVTAVAIPGVMTSAGVAAMAGVAFGALAFGEMLAALGFGARTWRGQRPTQLLVSQSMVVIIAVLIFVIAAQPWFLVLVMFIAGAMRAPVSILQSSLLDEVMPKGHLARSYSALVAVTLISHSVGSASAGLLADHIGAHAVLLVPVLALALGSIWIAARYSTLRA
ncbi:MFS transporter [Nesterenkonia ebinurensis]|uniref:MFS transporter n=1 Tax=Nesterenkonia ebinurensis TaxID=2608252 RepID=UPI00123D36D4|nr:MFS transporter [Nesterenkonia ebinurensis]